MPAPSGSTPVFGLPYLLETDIPDIATASQLLAQAVENVLETVGVPVGGDIGWWSDTLPTIGSWQFLHGQRLVGGAAAYPRLASLKPTWVSGADIVLPDTRNNVAMGAGGLYAVGTTGGSATVTLAQNNIPQFVNQTVTLPSLNHSHGGATQGESNHTHSFSSSTILNQAAPGNPYFNENQGGTGQYNFSAILGMVTGPGTNHIHGINPDGITAANGAVTFGTASPAPISTIQPFIASHRIIRVA